MMNSLINEVRIQGDLTQKLIDIDKKYDVGGVSPMTISASEKYTKLNDSLQSWSARAESLNNNDTLGYKVYFSCDFAMTDGTTTKELPILLNFDKDNDIRKEWNLVFK